MQNKSILDIAARIRPHVTEKSMKASENNVVAFLVPTDVTKTEIKNVIEYLYKDVKVINVSSSLAKGKVKRFRGKIGKRPDTKKMYIRLDKSIDITSGIK